MQSKVKIGPVLLLLFFLTGCMAYPTNFTSYQEGTRHYQGTDRFKEVALDVRFSGEGSSLEADFKQAATQYLEANGVSVVPLAADGGQSVATLSLLIGKRGDNHIIVAKLIAADGTAIEETPLFQSTYETEGVALAQHLATLAIDDLLFLWYPAKGGTSSTASAAKFTLLTNDLPRQTLGGDTTLSWEAFPSSRLLRGSAIDERDIKNVTYELRIHKAGTMWGAFRRYTRSLAYRETGIQQPSFSLPFSLPSCEKIVWSVRARFELAGHRRVTEWSGHYSTMYNGIGPLPVYPPYIHRRSVDQDKWGPVYRSFPLDHQAGGGSMEKVDPPREVKCGELHRGISSQENLRASAEFDRQLGPVLEGQSIAVSSVTERECVSARCGIAVGTADTTSEMAVCLAREFKRRSLDIPIVHFDKNDVENVRYVLSTKTHIQEEATTLSSNASDSPLADVSQSTQYSASMTTTVTDAGSGEVLGRFGAGDAGQQSQNTSFFLFIPVMKISTSGIGDMERNSCDEVARRLSFMLRGGVSTGWPEEYFKPISARLWEPEQ